MSLGDFLLNCGVQGSFLVNIFVLYLLILTGSQEMSLFMYRYKSKDLVRLILLSGMIFGNVMMAFNLNDGSKNGKQQCKNIAAYVLGFDMGYIVSRAFYSLLSLTVVMYVPEAK